MEVKSPCCGVPEEGVLSSHLSWLALWEWLSVMIFFLHLQSGREILLNSHIFLSLWKNECREESNVSNNPKLIIAPASLTRACFESQYVSNCFQCWRSYIPGSSLMVDKYSSIELTGSSISQQIRSMDIAYFNLIPINNCYSEHHCLKAFPIRGHVLSCLCFAFPKAG